MDKQIIIHTYNRIHEILLGSKKEQSNDMSYNLAEPENMKGLEM